MTKTTSKTCAAALLAGGAVLATAANARATSIDCTTLKNPVYIAGGSAAKPHLLNLAAALQSSGVNVSLIYAAPTACIGLGDVTMGLTEASSASYLDPTTSPPSAVTCTGSGTNPYPAIYIDIGVSGAYPSSCITPVITLGSGFADFEGPIEAFEISVPWTSNQDTITADAAYVVFGWGGVTSSGYTVSPWNVPTAVWTRGDTSAVQLLVAGAIGLKASSWLTNTGDAGLAQVLTSESTMVSTLAASTTPNNTIGILGSGGLDPVKSATGNVKPLAFQATNQDCGYYADSAKSAFDKINVRQGRYDIWGPEHFVTAVDGSGNPLANTLTSGNPKASTTASVKSVIDYITHKGLTTPQLQTVIAAETNAYFIPECAMQVSRAAEDGVEASYQPTGACGCYFESLTGGGTTLSSYCKKCTDAKTDCTTAPYNVCNYGYCEAK